MTINGKTWITQNIKIIQGQECEKFVNRQIKKEMRGVEKISLKLLLFLKENTIFPELVGVWIFEQGFWWKSIGNQLTHPPSSPQAVLPTNQDIKSSASGKKVLIQRKFTFFCIRIWSWNISEIFKKSTIFPHYCFALLLFNVLWSDCWKQIGFLVLICLQITFWKSYWLQQHFGRCHLNAQFPNIFLFRCACISQ